MKLTQVKKVAEIVRPAVDGLPPNLSVGIADPIMRAVELMLKNDVTQIAVMGRCGLVGRVLLEEALQYLGLRLNAPLRAYRENATASAPPWPKKGE